MAIQQVAYIARTLNDITIDIRRLDAGPHVLIRIGDHLQETVLCIPCVMWGNLIETVKDHAAQINIALSEGEEATTH